MLYTLKDLKNYFSSAYLERGRAYQKQGRVRSLDVHENGAQVTAVVLGSASQRYRLIARVQGPPGAAHIRSECSCPLRTGCKHVAAALLQALTESENDSEDDSEQPQDAPDQATWAALSLRTAVATASAPPSGISGPAAVWLEELAQALRPESERNAYPASVQQRLLYILEAQQGRTGSRLLVKLFSTRMLKTGGYGKTTPYHNLSNAVYMPPQYFLPVDREIAVGLAALHTLNGGSGHLVLSGTEGVRLLRMMLATGRCHWLEADTPPLAEGGPRAASAAWCHDEDGRQRLIFQTSTTELAVLPLDPPWYVDAGEHRCGPLETPYPPRLAAALARAPELEPEDAATVIARMERNSPVAELPRPTIIPQTVLADIVPVPHLRLYAHDLNLPYYYRDAPGVVDSVDAAELSFDYAGNRVNSGVPTSHISRYEAGQLLRIARNIQAENQARRELEQFGFILFDEPGRPAASRSLGAAWCQPDEQGWIRFMLKQLSRLRNKGWQVEVEEGFGYDIVEVDEWYADVEATGNDWFGLDLGIQVQGKRISLLPIVVNAMRSLARQLSPKALAKLPDDHPVLTAMDDGRLIKLPLGRLRGILNTLIELHQGEPPKDGRLKLSALDAARLAELDSALKPRWLGGERLLELGRRLADFKSIAPAAPPTSLSATLRGYQREGLSWLQFLRQYQLSGILADDMGLGKTIQTLAHLLIEKESGRMDRPSLVIAPTSLMHNWNNEAARFAPSLRVLILQGLARKKDFDRIAEHDLILTTYPLLPRDKETLLAHEYHLLILDEAQNIKNASSQAARIASQIKTRHRLCLTGTPLENHLGELWSQFNFLLPGLLGDAQQFRKLFRTPIEKQGDDERRAALARRIKPFLLRRTKDLVAKELPPKTEIVRSIQLDGAQRDLYETIRVAMHDKVRQEIDKKGMERSQIIILDALLKLRQVCCDPRLLKLAAAKKVQESAKLELLMDLLPEMLDEGRRILLFSQFTSMLELIEQRLGEQKIGYVKLTGETRDRKTPVETFQSGKVPLFLISLKAGGVGLNLTAADTVIHYDPWWNPAVENQATDRAHRIGQDKPVFVYKLIVQGSVEEKITAMQARKAALAAGVLSGEGAAVSALSAADLSALFEPLT